MKKNVIFIGVSICLLVLLGIGLSYSMWNMSISQDTNNVIATTNDCFDIAITSQENSIKLENAYPISDTKGKTLTPFTFTIKNTCDMAASYSVSLESLKESTLSSQFLKVMVNDNDPKILNTLDSTDTVNTGSIENRVLDTGTIFKNKTKEYSIRLWIDYDTTMEDLDNETKVLKSKIIIKGVPSDEEEPVPDLLTERIPYLADRDTVNLASDDPDSNIRYIGANPDNYVYFNCSDYNNQTADTCELWRVIGLFNNVTKSDGTKENLVKIIRYYSLGEYSWNVKSDGTRNNNWVNSSVETLLNSGAYYNSTTGVIYNGVYSSDTSVTTVNIDFTSKGLKNDKTKNKIEEVVWNLGGVSSNYSSLSAKDYYNAKRGTSVYSGYPTTWTGKVGLIYPSDFLYSIKNNNVEDSYMYGGGEGGIYKWTMTSINIDSSTVLMAGGSMYGKVMSNTRQSPNDGCCADFFINPVVYLKSGIKVSGGTGSSNNPYRLNI